MTRDYYDLFLALRDLIFATNDQPVLCISRMNKLLSKSCSHLVDRFSLGSQGAMGAVVLGRGLGSATAYLGKYRLTI